MKLKRALLGDIVFQWKYGFYLLYAILCIVYIALLGALPVTVRTQAAAILIFSDPAAMGLFFMGAMILLEKSQRVLNAVAVSPLTHRDYILAKVLSLLLLSLLVALAIGVSAGVPRLPRVMAGTALASVTFTLLGITAATKIESLNQFLVVSMGIELVCFAPPILATLRPDWPLPALSPFDAAMRLIDGRSANALSDVLISLLLIALLYPVCLRQTARMFAGVGGVRL